MKDKRTLRYKFLHTGYKSDSGDMKWKFGKWYKDEGKFDMCDWGFRCSRGIYQAFSYVQGSILVRVEVRGKNIQQDDKEVWEEMRIVKSWRWTKKDSVLLAIYAASLVLKNFEKKYPNDKRPRQAIQVARRWVKNPTTKNKNAAKPASFAAWSASGSARSAAWSAAWSSWSVLKSAKSARRYALFAAWSAAWSARSAIYKKLDRWMLRHTKKLKVLKTI